MQDRKSDLLDAAKIIRISSDKNNAVEKELNAFASKESGIKVSEILQDVDAVKDDLEHVKLTINEVNEGMHDLRQRISSLGPKFDSEIGLASENGKYAFDRYQFSNLTKQYCFSFNIGE